MFELQMECLNVILLYQSKLCLCHTQNVRRRFCGTKANHVVATYQRLDNGIVAKASSLKSRLSLLYLKPQMKGINVLCLVDKDATQSFMSSKLTRELGFADAWNTQTHQCTVCKRQATWTKENGVAFDIIMWHIGFCGSHYATSFWRTFFLNP